jgi:hypothetical protein
MWAHEGPLEKEDSHVLVKLFIRIRERERESCNGVIHLVVG